MKMGQWSNEGMKYGVRKVFWNHVLSTLGLEVWGTFCEQTGTTEGL